MDLVKCISQLANLGSYAVDAEGYILQTGMNGQPERVKIGELELVVPTPFQLSGKVDPTWKSRMIFNPMAENITTQVPSTALKQLVTAVQFRLNVTLIALFREILRVATNPEAQKNLTSEQLEFIAKLHDVDETVSKFFDKVVLPKAAKTDFIFIKFFPKYVANLGGVDYSRASLVSFPMVEELSGPRLFGNATPVPKAASEKFIGLIKCVLRDVLTKDAYSAGSNGRVAPFFESFISSVIKLANDIRRVQQIWPEMWNGLAEPERFGVLDTGWLEVFRNCDALADAIRAVPAIGDNGVDSAPSMQMGNPPTVAPAPQDVRRYEAQPQRNDYYDRRDYRNDRNDDRRDGKVTMADFARRFGPGDRNADRRYRDDEYDRRDYRSDRRSDYDYRDYDNRRGGRGGTNWQ